MTITITHPGARLLAPVLDTLADVVAGDWTTAARVCAPRLRDTNACAADLHSLAARAGVLRVRRQSYRYRVRYRMLLVDEHPSLLAAALDLHMRLMLGQWDALERAVPPDAQPTKGWRPVELLDARIQHQLPDTWSDRPYASESLFLAPPIARLAHHVLTELEGGVACAYDVPAGSAAIHVG